MVFESFPKKLSIAVVHLYMLRPPFSWIHNNFVVGRSRKIHKEGKTMNTNTNNQNDQGYPEIADELMELVNSPHVERLEFDSGRLVDSWVLEAESWLLYSDNVLQFTALEAFEGIEHLGRLTRTKPTMLAESEGEDALKRIGAIYTGEHAAHLLKLAFQAPSPTAGLEQVKEMDQILLTSWDDVSECAANLLEDHDALEFLLWWAGESGLVTPEYIHEGVWEGFNLGKFQEECSQFSASIADNPEAFLLCEAQVRSIATTVREDLATVDRLCSGMGTRIYLSLLFEFERTSIEDTPAEVRINAIFGKKDATSRDEPIS